MPAARIIGPEKPQDRKSVVQGKRVDIGGRRVINKKKRAYEIYQCEWSSDVCSSDLVVDVIGLRLAQIPRNAGCTDHRAGEAPRSEERRAGKEGRYRWAPCH